MKNIVTVLSVAAVIFTFCLVSCGKQLIKAEQLIKNGKAFEAARGGINISSEI